MTLFSSSTPNERVLYDGTPRDGRGWFGRVYSRWLSWFYPHAQFNSFPPDNLLSISPFGSFALKHDRHGLQGDVLRFRYILYITHTLFLSSNEIWPLSLFLEGWMNNKERHYWAFASSGCFRPPHKTRKTRCSLITSSSSLASTSFLAAISNPVLLLLRLPPHPHHKRLLLLTGNWPGLICCSHFPFLLLHRQQQQGFYGLFKDDRLLYFCRNTFVFWCAPILMLFC